MEIFNNLFGYFFDKPIKLREYKSNGVCGIYCFDRDFVCYLKDELGLVAGKKLKVKIPEFIDTMSKKKAFIRGVFDTDGSIYYCKSNFKTKNRSYFTEFQYKPKIKLATISKSLIESVYEILMELGFNPRFRKPSKQREKENTMYGVVLYRKKDVQRYITEIGSKNIKHSSKVEIVEKYGFCPPNTNLKQRMEILSGDLSPLFFYEAKHGCKLNEIKQALSL